MRDFFSFWMLLFPLVLMILGIFKYSVGCNGDPVIQLVGLWILAPGRKHKYFVPRRNRKDRLSMEKNLQPPVLFAKGFNLLLSETPG